MKKHSDFSPSSFERRYLCPASYLMEKDLPPTKSKYADEGTLLHELVTIDIREYLRIQNDKPVLDAYLHYLENVKTFQLVDIIRASKEISVGKSIDETNLCRFKAKYDLQTKFFNTSMVETKTQYDK